MATDNDCSCSTKKPKDGRLFKGIFYGIFPHIFCIGFIIFSAVGATLLTAVFKKILLIPYFFHLLVAISFLFATISALIYLKKLNCLCSQGIKSKWKYITTLYAITILSNLLMFFVVFPAMANINSNKIADYGFPLEELSITVKIPCSGHAPLITDELKKIKGIEAIKFRMLDEFEIKYNPQITSPEKIIGIDIFKTYKATIKGRLQTNN